MEKQDLKNLFEAVKNDDVKTFSFIMQSKSDLNVCFGRFPLLSLLYLFGSYEILNQYEKFLVGINKFEVVFEPYEIYKKFKTKAKKCLKLYLKNDSIVYPIEMLAVLDERFLILNLYKSLFKNEEILTNLRKIYKINQKIEIDATMQNIQMETKRLSGFQKFIASVVSFIVLISAMISVVFLVIVGNGTGLGTEKSPIKISTEQELQTAIAKGSRYFVLKKDITLTKEFDSSNFSGVIDGNGKTIYASEYLTSGLVDDLSGTIKDLNIEIDDNGSSIDESVGIFATNSTGKITKCRISGNLSWTTIADDEIYLSCFVAKNKGVIEDVESKVEVVISNARETNVFFAPIAGNNSGEVLNSKNTATKFETDTVDVSGIVSFNSGKVVGSKNIANISQRSEKEWHPNTSGVVTTNTGLIDGCVNMGNIASQSTIQTLSKPEEGQGEKEIHVYAAGIVCENSGEVSRCLNEGNVSGIGAVAFVFAGGIASMNAYKEISQDTFAAGKIKNSKSTKEVFAESEKSGVYVGGIAAFNASYVQQDYWGQIYIVNEASIDSCGFEGKLRVDSVYSYIGGVVGQNRYSAVMNCYSWMNFENNSGSAQKELIVSGVVGYTYPIAEGQLKNNHYVSSDSFTCGVKRISSNGISYMYVDVSDEQTGSTKYESIDKISSEVKNVL